MRGLKWLFGTLVTLATVGALFQIVGMVLDRQHYRPPGRMIDVGSHRLHLYCTGTGSPTVVLEAAAPGWSLYWSLVQPEVATMTRVCAYDRAGLGWSERGPLPRTAQRMARELHRLLERAEIPGPYILVGHSLGGFVTRLYRQEYPKDVAGMVLVDAGQESEIRQAEFRTFVNAGKSQLPVMRAMTMLGIPRLLAEFDYLPPFLARQEQQVPETIRPMLRAGWLRTRYIATLADEGEALIHQLREQRRHLRGQSDGVRSGHGPPAAAHRQTARRGGGSQRGAHRQLIESPARGASRAATRGTFAPWHQPCTRRTSSAFSLSTWNATGTGRRPSGSPS